MKKSLSNVYNPLFTGAIIAFIIGVCFVVGFPHPIAIAGMKIASVITLIILAIAIIIAAISANRSCGMFFFTYWYWFFAEIFLILGVEIILSLFVDKSMALFFLEEGNELYRSLFLFTFFTFPAIGNLITRSL